MTRVVQIFGAMDVGGAEMRALDLVRAVEGSGVSFDFVTLSGRVGSMAPEFEALGARVVPMRIGVLFPLRFLRYLARERPDVVHSHIALTSGLMVYLARLVGTPTRIAHFHSDGDGHPDGWWRRRYRRFMARLVDGYATEIVGVSPSALACGYRPGWEQDPRIRLVANGVDVARFVPRTGHLPGSPVRIVSVGRASPEKNLTRMPAVLAAYTERHGEALLDVVGPRDAAIDQEVASEAERLGVGAEVRLHPSRADVPEVLRTADVLLLTSWREGLPSVVLEAAVMGVPVVSSDVGGSQWIAETFPWVKCLSLSADDAEWADCLRAAVQQQPSAPAVKRAVDSSAFTMSAHARSILDVYEKRA